MHRLAKYTTIRHTSLIMLIEWLIFFYSNYIGYRLLKVKSINILPSVKIENSSKLVPVKIVIVVGVVVVVVEVVVVLVVAMVAVVGGGLVLTL